jgi:hypothetical protein
MHTYTILAIFFFALIAAIARGVSWTFVFIYIPALILFNQLQALKIPHLPLSAPFGPLYAILLALPFNTEPLRFRWNWLDTIVISLLISSTITGWTTEYFETGINNLRQETLQWFGPYFLARIIFRSWETRRMALYCLIGLIAFLSVDALIEFRLWPYFYLHTLQAMGMGNYVHPMAYYRFGFIRVAGPVEHPIYFGNMCVVLLGMVTVLARTSGMSLKQPLVGLAVFGAFGCVITSISFTPYMGMLAGTAFFLTLVFVPWSRQLVLPMVLLVGGVIFAFTYQAAHEKLGEAPDGELQGSYWTRKLIVNQSWKIAEKAGPFGFGEAVKFADDPDFDLASVDNSYMLFAMKRGWVYTLLWISIAPVFALRVWKAFRHVSHPSQVFPLAVATATVLGLMVSMYTVWAGALYTVLWFIMLGLSNTLIDLVVYPEWQPPKRLWRVRVRRDSRQQAAGSGQPLELPPAGRPVMPAVR